MSRFWRYFKDKLRWPWIQAAGPLSVLVKGGALVLDDVRDDIIWLRLQAFPDTCDDRFLDIHGQARGVYRRKNEPVDKYRTRVIKAYAWQLLGAKNAGLPQVLNHYGYPSVRVHNMRTEDTERWAEFKVKMPGLGSRGMTEDDFLAIDDVVNDQKPARSRLAAITVESDATDAITNAGVVRVTKKFRLLPYVHVGGAQGARSLGSVVRHSTRIRILPSTFPPQMGVPGAALAGMAIRKTIKLTIGAQHV